MPAPRTIDTLTAAHFAATGQTYDVKAAIAMFQTVMPGLTAEAAEQLVANGLRKLYPSASTPAERIDWAAKFQEDKHNSAALGKLREAADRVKVLFADFMKANADAKLDISVSLIENKPTINLVNRVRKPRTNKRRSYDTLAADLIEDGVSDLFVVKDKAIVNIALIAGDANDVNKTGLKFAIEGRSRCDIGKLGAELEAFLGYSVNAWVTVKLPASGDDKPLTLAEYYDTLHADDVADEAE